MTLAHPDPALQQARAAATRALIDRWQASGWAEVYGDLCEPLATLNAEIAVNAAWPVAKRTFRLPMEDGR
jgi:hypothetical protein